MTGLAEFFAGAETGFILTGFLFSSRWAFIAAGILAVGVVLLYVGDRIVGHDEYEDVDDSYTDDDLEYR